jgi:hypothetical protein
MSRENHSLSGARLCRAKLQDTDYSSLAGSGDGHSGRLHVLIPH